MISAPQVSAKALTIGTSDSSALSGVQGDLKTWAALSVYGTSVVTAVAARNRRELAAVAEVPDEVVIAQLDAVLEDIGADAIKVGALWSRSIAENVADRLEAWGNRRVVLSPTTAMVIEAGRLDAALLRTLRQELVPQAFVVTLDVQEAELLSGLRIESAAAAIEACRRLRGEGGCSVHLSAMAESDMSHDLLLDGDEVVELAATRRASADAGELFSAALTAFLARGLALRPAVAEASRYRDEAPSR